MSVKMLGAIGIFSLVGWLLGGLIKKNKDLTKSMTNSIRGMSNEMKLATFDMASNIVAGTIETQFAINDLGQVINQTSGEVIGSWDAVKKAVVDANGDIIYSFNEADGTILDATGNIVGHFKNMSDDFSTEEANIVGSIDASTGAISGFFGDMKVRLREDGTIINTETGKIVGYFDSLTGTITDFETDATASVEDAGTGIAQSLADLNDSINEMDFSGVTDSVDAFSDNFQEQMEENAIHMAALSAIMVGAQFGLPGLIVGLGAAAALESWIWVPALQEEIAKLVSTIGDAKDEIDLLMDSLLPWQEQMLRADGPIQALTRLIEDWGYSLGDANRIIEEMFGNSIGTMVDKDLTPAIEKLARFNEALNQLSTANVAIGDVGGGLGMDGALGGAVTQHITIHSTVVIENVSGIADLEMVEDASNRGISEAMRRRDWT